MVYIPRSVIPSGHEDPNRSLISGCGQEAVNFIVVFDWGGGTLDVSLLHVQGGMFTTHAIAGNKHLGGEDVTRRLFDYCLRVYSAGQPEGYTPSPELRQRFRAEAERLKLALSTKTHDTLEVDVGGGERFTLDVTREKFEEVNVDLFEATMEPLHAVSSTCPPILPPTVLFCSNVDVWGVQACSARLAVVVLYGTDPSTVCLCSCQSRLAGFLYVPGGMCPGACR